jgi:hypothetical protein
MGSLIFEPQEAVKQAKISSHGQVLFWQETRTSHSYCNRLADYILDKGGIFTQHSSEAIQRETLYSETSSLTIGPVATVP